MFLTMRMINPWEMSVKEKLILHRTFFYPKFSAFLEEQPQSSSSFGLEKYTIEEELNR